MVNQNNPCSLFCNQNPWNRNGNDIWLGTTLTLLRNLEKFKFPNKLETDKRKQILSLLNKNLLKSDQLNQPRLFKAEEMQPIEKEFLVEHFLTHESFHQARTGEGFILDESGTFLAGLNIRDHLMLQWIDIKEDLEASWERLFKIETDLNHSINFAFSPKFGFLTSDPTRCGTGFIVTVFLHLPGLIYTSQLDEVLLKDKDEGIEQTGLQGNPNEIIGDVVAFHNNYTLGLTEENILSSLRTLATRLVTAEKSVRNMLKQEQHQEIYDLKDKVCRAYAILLHSYQIESIEAMKAISLLKLGLELNWLSGIDQMTLNDLLFSIRRAHLLCHQKEKTMPEELPHKRADFIHKALKGSQLLIQE